MKKIVYLIMLLMMISLVSPTLLGSFKSGECVELIQTCSNCTYNKISSLLYPNSSQALTEATMTKADTYYNYTFCDTNVLGTYVVNGYGDLEGVKQDWNYDFEITGTGFELTQSRSMVYLGMLAILFILFLVNVAAVPMLPSRNTQDNDDLISISKLKYLRAVLCASAYVILLAVVFTASNIASAYLGTTMFSDLLFAIFQIMGWLMLPAVVLWFIWIFYMVFKDKETKRLIERGFYGSGI